MDLWGEIPGVRRLFHRGRIQDRLNAENRPIPSWSFQPPVEEHEQE